MKLGEILLGGPVPESRAVILLISIKSYRDYIATWSK